MRFILFLVSLCLSVAISMAIESRPAAGTCTPPIGTGAPGDPFERPAAPAQSDS